ncbi:putative ABC transport system membrane protein [Nostocoides japonicum T1-X7]|uniref:Putative ABC transport system membrane protein n=1 Tax=Nostocoides japonicum T1-X7 TaxID=1194083 RepID=A0A077M3K6_9MICO|nr:hypothetical protein [Tetrasphaera japonica]CCH78715.1 putative ABC transport system membrane protein [Tetrasphaera japonica T1-X7]
MGGAVRSELRKVFTTRLWWGLLLGVVFLDGLISFGFSFLVGADLGGDNPSASPFLHPNAGTIQLVFSAGFVYYLTPLIPLTLGVLLITSEFRHKTISATYLAVPVRPVVVAAKLVAVVVTGAMYALVHDLAVVAAGGGVLTLRGQPTFLDSGDVWQTLGVSLLTFVCWALLGFGFGMLIQNQIAAILVGIGVGFLAQIILGIVFGLLSWDGVSRWLPGNLSVGMLVTQDPTNGAQASSGDPYFSWWVSALLLTAYGLALSIIGSWIASRRDIT